MSRSSLTALSILIGLFVGIGLFTFGYARGASYLTDDPQACANCHVMNEQYDSWRKSSHHSAAVCNDCHTPPGAVSKYVTKALNGFFHSYAFTSGDYPDNIQITGRNRRVTQQACMKCHEQITDQLQAVRGHDQKLDCLTCHNDVGHH